MIGGEQKQIDRSTITSRKPLHSSLMPAGLHRGLSEQELADLVAYLSELKSTE